MASAHKGFMGLVSVTTILVSSIVFAWTQYNSLATDTELKEAVEVYDHGYKGELKDNEDWRKGGLPEKTRRKLEMLETLVQKTRADQIRRDKDQRKLWWWQIGYQASEKEPCAKLRAAAASFYRSQFTLQLEERPDISYEVAFTTALNTPWHERQSLARRGCR